MHALRDGCGTSEGPAAIFTHRSIAQEIVIDINACNIALLALARKDDVAGGVIIHGINAHQRGGLLLCFWLFRGWLLRRGRRFRDCLCRRRLGLLKNLGGRIGAHHSDQRFLCLAFRHDDGDALLGGDRLLVSLAGRFDGDCPASGG